MPEQNPELETQSEQVAEPVPDDERPLKSNIADEPELALPSQTRSPWRWPILFVNVILLGTCVGWVALDPKVGRLQVYEFPEQVALDSAQHQDSDRLKPVKKPEYEGSSYPAGQHYQYRVAGRPLDVEIRYVIKTQGGVDKFTREHPHFADAEEQNAEVVAQLRFDRETGHYALLNYNERTYLSACINPRGKTTASSEQYVQNQDLYDTVLGRTGTWLLGRERWRDNRCLWTLMYTPTGANSQQSQARLEALWEEWAPYWQTNFPPL
ncbi:MAG: cyanoexosortase A system-associated protein [Cyanobacteria bacterium P01_G01_bin.54]